MAWNEDRAIARIKEHIKRAPSVDANLTLARVRADAATARSEGRFPNTRAILVEGAQLYGQLVDFDDLVVEQGKGETEASHKRVLDFLNTHYQVWDSIVDGDDALRVDFHGPRLHAVVVYPIKDPREQILRAMALAAKLGEAAARVGQAYGFSSRIRFGIDQGRCLAMTTGRSHDTDTLFLGSPANHAAKLASSGQESGIFLMPNAQQIVTQVPSQSGIPSFRARQDLIDLARRQYPFTSVDAAANRVIASATNRAKFGFRRATPPLSKTKFSELSPSNTVRMGMASLFADIDGYTAFVDNAIRQGPEAIKTAVVGIHVIREELNDVLKADCEGKRVRFIGDCIHGLMTKGTVATDDDAGAVLDACMCAAAMKSSFDLCCEIVPGLQDLDLAIGIDYGVVPLTRIGRPGEESIRCAAGKAVIESERAQQQIENGGTRLGEGAMNVASHRVRQHFGSTRRIPEYDDAANLLGAPVSQVTTIISQQPSARSHVS
ncbi:adenylate/guanylate cyclase domain-containing protein [Taklimakanibacter lacteus]|uniref:adenylate/guanylate cyclase domain-containing protein n=1 Tax=Taklimakanibacter lacteus TaxID=2268456 RepID=UPI000E6754DD